jgi:halimadienyl-diphosphate synthase
MAPVLHPCELFELLWAAYHLYLAGVPVDELLTPADRTRLREALAQGGVSLSPSFPIPDADDTAVALLLLHELGEPVDLSVLEAFALPGRHFASFPHERHPSVGVNLHVLHTLLRVPGYPDQERTIERLVDYIADQQLSGLYWVDKWHISPYYATAHALCVFRDLPPEHAARVKPLVEGAREWIRQTQHGEGSWGFYGEPTAEETAYAVLGLTAAEPPDLTDRDRQQCTAALRYLSLRLDPAKPAEELFPPLWIDKCLYLPTLVVQAVIEAARAQGRR